MMITTPTIYELVFDAPDHNLLRSCSFGVFMTSLIGVCDDTLTSFFEIDDDGKLTTCKSIAETNGLDGGGGNSSLWKALEEWCRIEQCCPTRLPLATCGEWAF